MRHNLDFPHETHADIAPQIHKDFDIDSASTLTLKDYFDIDCAMSLHMRQTKPLILTLQRKEHHSTRSRSTSDFKCIYIWISALLLIFRLVV